MEKSKNKHRTETNKSGGRQHDYRREISDKNKRNFGLPARIVHTTQKMTVKSRPKRPEFGGKQGRGKRGVRTYCVPLENRDWAFPLVVPVDFRQLTVMLQSIVG